MSLMSFLPFILYALVLVSLCILAFFMYLYFIVEKYPEYQSENDHHAIIVASYPKQELIHYPSGVDLLIRHFLKNKEPYKIYRCFNPPRFKEVIEDGKAKNLWIFGHGSRGSIQFGKKDKLCYSEFEGLNLPKVWIAQFHCCHKMEKSLADYLHPQESFISTSYRRGIQNRKDIKDILREGENIKHLDFGDK